MMVTRSKPTISNTLIAIPALNEAASIVVLIEEIRAQLPGYSVLVISDGSTDRTAALAHVQDVQVLDLPCNLGVGGAIQAGFRFAWERGYEYLVRLDADGQHPPSEIPKLVAAMTEFGTDLVIASRYCGERSYRSTPFRLVGIRCLAALLSLTCRKRVTDPTSGFHMFHRGLIYCFSQNYPVDYPEPEALAFMRRQGYDFMEVSADFRERQAGSSTIDGLGTLYYMVKVFLALLVDRARPVNPQLSRDEVMKILDERHDNI